MSASYPAPVQPNPTRMSETRRLGRRGVLSGVAPNARLTLVTDPLRLLLFLLTIVTISRVHLHYPMLAKMRPVLLLSIAAVGYAFLHPRSLTRENVLAFWPIRLVALIAVLACLSAPFGISLGNSGLFILDSFSKTLAYAFLVALSVRYAGDLYTMVWAFVLSSGILAVFAVFVFNLEPALGDTARLAEMYTYDSNDLGVILMIGLPLTLLLLFVDHGAKRWLLVLNLIGISAAMARSGSRGGFLGLVAVALASLFFVKGVSATRRSSVLAVAVIALAFAAPPGYWAQMGTIMSPKSDYNYSSVDGRSALIKRGVGYMAKYPLFGIGIWNFAKAECSISPKVARQPQGGVRCVAPHNSFLQAGSEMGFPGLVAWVSLLVGLIVGPLRLRRRLPRSWRRGTAVERFLYASTSFFPVAMCGFAVTSFFVSFAFADPLYLMAALTTGLYIVVKAELGRRNSGSNETIAPPASPSRDRPGWRVRQSAQRLLTLAPNWGGPK
jgi:O-antigen ligase